MSKNTKYGQVPIWAVDIRKTPSGKLICTNDDKRYLYIDRINQQDLSDKDCLSGDKDYEGLISNSVVICQL